jgi:hypothetical protein
MLILIPDIPESDRTPSTVSVLSVALVMQVWRPPVARKNRGVRGKIAGRSDSVVHEER